MTEEDSDLSKAEFTRRAIKQLRELPEKGIHSEYSGFNDAFRKYFDEDPERAISRLEDRGEIATMDAEGGIMLFLPGEAPETDPDEMVSKIVGSDEGLPDVTELSGNAPPVVIDQEGLHETTEYALIPSEERFWLRNFREDGKKVAVKSVYRSKEDLKSMDRDRTEWKWDGDEKIWAINTSGLEYAIDHFLSNGYDVAASPEITEYMIKELGFSVDYMEKDISSEAKEITASYDVDEKNEGKPNTESEADRETEYMDSPELEEINTVEEENGERTGDEIKVDDVVEHDSGQRGKVVDKESGTLIVSTGPDSRNQWSEGACEFIREGR